MAVRVPVSRRALVSRGGLVCLILLSPPGLKGMATARPHLLLLGWLRVEDRARSRLAKQDQLRRAAAATLY